MAEVDDNTGGRAATVTTGTGSEEEKELVEKWRRGLRNGGYFGRGWESLWPPSEKGREGMVELTAERLLSPPFYERHTHNSAVMFSPDEAKEAALSIEAEAYAPLADAKPGIADGFKIILRYTTAVTRRTIALVKSRTSSTAPASASST